MTSRAYIDAAAAGAFLDMTITKAKALVEKMVSNQGWSEERLQPHTKGMHTVKETDMIAAKLVPPTEAPLRKARVQEAQRKLCPSYEFALRVRSLWQ